MNAQLKKIALDLETTKKNFYKLRDKTKADPRLSDWGKVQPVNDAREKANEEIVRLRTQFEKTRLDRIAELVSQLFGIRKTSSMTDGDYAAAEMSLRDAIARTSDAKTEGKLAELLRNAQLINDRTMIKAVGLAAYQDGFYEMARGTLREVDWEDFDELVELTTMFTTHQQKINRNMLFGLIGSA